jgi:hypothetical protein
VLSHSNHLVMNIGLSPRISSLVVGLGVLGIASFYLVQWADMPLYQDEVALRATRARFLIDGWTDYGLYAQCKSSTRQIALIFEPVAYLYSAFDAAFGWAGIRALPITGVLIALGSVLTQFLARRALAPSLFLLTGLIGVAGSGLVLSRMETPTLLFGAVCMAGFSIIQRTVVSPGALAGYFAISTFLALFSLYIHPEAMVFVPVVVLLATATLLQSRHQWLKVVAALSVVCVSFGSFAASDDVEIHCPEKPALQTQLDRMGLPGLAREQGLAGLQINLSGKLERYANNFLFRKDYDVGYLPSVEPSSHSENSLLRILSASIFAAVLLNLVLACCVALGTAALIFRSLFKVEDWHKTAASVIKDPVIYLFVISSGHLALFLYDTPTNFYRAFYIHLVLVITNSLVLSEVGGKLKRALYPLGACGLVLCIISATVARQEIRTKLVDHWEGPSVSLQTDWRGIRAVVQQLEGICGISPSDPRIVVDELTYDAMKRHSKPLLIRWLVLGESKKMKDRAESSQFFRHLSATGVLAGCRSLDNFDLDIQARANGLCCLKF